MPTTSLSHPLEIYSLSHHIYWTGYSRFFYLFINWLEDCIHWFSTFYWGSAEYKLVAGKFLMIPISLFFHSLEITPSLSRTHTVKIAKFWFTFPYWVDICTSLHLKVRKWKLNFVGEAMVTLLHFSLNKFRTQITHRVFYSRELSP